MGNGNTGTVKLIMGGTVGVFYVGNGHNRTVKLIRGGKLSAFARDPPRKYVLVRLWPCLHILLPTVLTCVHSPTLV